MDQIKKLLALNVNDHTEKKNGLTYLSWSWAWAKMLELCPTATYEVAKNADGVPAFGNDKIGYMCYTKVTVDSITHEMWLPVMDHRNKTILQPNMFDINKTVMRCLTKNLAMFGLGLYVYSGEDLPEEEQQQPKPKATKQASQLITPEQAADLVTLITEANSDLAKVLAYYQLTKLEDMTTIVYAEAVKMLEKKRGA